MILTGLAERSDGIELSASVASAEVERRALFFLDHRPGNVALAAHAARALGLPGALVDRWQRTLGQADAIMLALREDRRSVRLYTQFWDRVARRHEAGRRDLGPLYLGFKALADGTERVDAYEVLPEAPETLFRPPLEAALEGIGVDRTALGAALAPLDARSAIVTRTRGHGRASWLVTVRRAGLDRALVARAFAPLARHERLADLVAGLARKDLLHVAGGHDRTKGRFVTLYRAADPAEALARLIRPVPARGS